MLDLNSTMIGSEDADRLVEFYGKFLGKPTFEDGGFSGWQVGTAWLTIGPAR